MSGYVGYLPATVRLDKSLSPMAKLIYAELTSSCDITGETKVTVPQIAELFQVDEKTVKRGLNLLADKGYISKSKTGIKISDTGIVVKIIKEVHVDAPAKTDSSLSDITKEILSKWNKFHKTKLGKTVVGKKYYARMIEKRLETFSSNDLLYAIESRYQNTKDDPWFMKHEKYMKDLELVLRDDEAVLKYVEMQLPNPEKVTAFKFDKGDKDILK